MSKLAILTKGIVKENPVLVSMLGCCPVLAVSTQASNAIGMGVATTFVLLSATVIISLLRNFIQAKVRIPCYIMINAGLVAFVQMIVQAYAYPLYLSLGIFLPLITVNCVIFSRAEIFAQKNSVFDTALDALGMGAGFTLTLLAMASIREIIGSGKWFSFELPLLTEINIPIFAMAPGGFVVFGFLIAMVNLVSRGRAIKKKEFGCTGCASASVCGKGVCE